MSVIDTKNLLTWAEAAAVLGCSVRHLQREKTAGRIGFIAIGQGARPRVYFSRQHVDDYRKASVKDVRPKRRSA